ncbi:hypothetical protein GMO_09830 [Gluconobacter morbifer G707]|uniref:Uncharacterized protein n=2 Tax=Gluconobacter TaxID=441 RepID=G6XHL7_9PROT|nr:hypothetical protein GMO_09830 [Gluconobacter morbifer G707]
MMGLFTGSAMAAAPKIDDAVVRSSQQRTDNNSVRPVAEKVTVTSEDEMENCNKVWVNTATHVYHLSGSFWYGSTAHGKYMCEQDAKRTGNTAGQF